MRTVLFFEVHQPLRIKPLASAPPGALLEGPEEVFNWDVNDLVFKRVSERVYIKASKVLLGALKENRDFKFTLSVSGITLEQLREKAPEALRLFEEMVESERVEFAAQTYYHSLAWLVDRGEFVEQVLEQAKLLEELLGYKPSSAENTEFIYNNDVGCTLSNMGFKAVVTEGVEWVQGFKGYNHVYTNPLCGIRILLRNYGLSDDLGFRFSLRDWDQHPLTASKYVSWLQASPGEVVMVALDYETFGEHQWPETGIYEFLEWLPREAERSGLVFSTVAEAASEVEPQGVYDVPPWSTISWADERDLSAWVGNDFQKAALEKLRTLYYYSKALGDRALRLWRLYSMSDHFYYQATKTGPAGEVHNYFNPYGSPYKAQVTYITALEAFSKWVVERARRNYCNFLSKFTAPEELCFYFKTPGGSYTGFKACSMSELLESLQKAPGESIEYHEGRGDIERWAREVLLAREGFKAAASKCGLLGGSRA
ncbi:MAG: alpha-amylase [Thermoprotei archaeon]|nr:alpha-amylase [Thermoprotei archaeon]